MWFKTTAEDGEREGAAVTCDGRLFHRQAAATGNALSSTVDRRLLNIKTHPRTTIDEPSTSTSSSESAAVTSRIEYGTWWHRAPRWRMSSSPMSGDNYTRQQQQTTSTTTTIMKRRHRVLKSRPPNLSHNVVKYWPIFKILSLSHSLRNLEYSSVGMQYCNHRPMIKYLIIS